MVSQESFTYMAYGLLIRSNLCLPGLYEFDPDDGRADLTVKMGPFPDYLNKLIAAPDGLYHAVEGKNRDNPLHLEVNTLSGNSFLHFRYDTGVEFVVARDASQVWGNWIEPFCLEDAVLYLQGPILAFILRLRGLVCLHASSVVMNGQAVVFAGHSGTGKSTLAAACGAAGFSVITDDILPLVKADDEVLAVSGYPRMRLYQSDLLDFKMNGAELPHLSSNWEKRYLDLRENNFPFVNGTKPIGCIYLYDWSKRNQHYPQILPVRPVETIPLLAGLSYGNVLLDKRMKKIEFYFLTQVARIVPVRKIQPVIDQRKIPELIELIEDDFSRI